LQLDVVLWRLTITLRIAAFTHTKWVFPHGITSLPDAS